MLLAFSKMPGKSHWPDRGRDFDYKNSEVVQWLFEQPDLWKWVFDKANSMGVIVFDPKTKLWHGVDTDDGKRMLSEKENEKSST